MLSTSRYHEISEASHRILNPLSEEKLHLVGEICDLRADQQLLDLGSGKGEMLCQYAARHGTRGIGIDVYQPFVDIARSRARELGVDDKVSFECGDAAQFTSGDRFDVVAAIGTTIGLGLEGVLERMRSLAAPDAWFLLGDVFWTAEPSPRTRAAHEHPVHSFTNLGATHDRLERAGFTLLEMMLADQDDWDRYATSQWLDVERWLESHTDHPDAAELRERRDQSRRAYLAEERGCLGWGVFILKRR